MTLSSAKRDRPDRSVPVEHIEGRASDPPACQNVRERLLIDDWPRAVLMKKAVFFIRARLG